jgi:hypothetical protein
LADVEDAICSWFFFLYYFMICNKWPLLREEQEIIKFYYYDS